MKKILLLGAGRSATVLISYLIEQATLYGWRLTIADVSVEQMAQRGLPVNVRLIPFDIQDEDLVLAEITQADLVISMLPAAFHPAVAKWCLQMKKNLITASYVTPQIKAMDAAARDAGLTFLMEAGLDPGIDHMSAMAIIAKIKQQDGDINVFKSYTGGLMAPESNTNPWHYKFTWNPRNVIVAGQGTAKYLETGQIKFIPYQQLFNRTESLSVLSLGEFDGYANRDSLPYREAYQVQDVATLIRGTLRRKGYCRAWHQLVQLGLTDDSYSLPNNANMTYRTFIQSYLPAPQVPNQPWHEQLAGYLNLPPESEEIARIKWLEFPEEPIGLPNATPAQVLEKLLTRKWQLRPEDKDMVVMQHIFEYKLGDQKRRLISSLVVIGEDNQRTAMAKTVGLPVGIIAKLMLQNLIPYTGIVIPTLAAIYEPVLAELEKYGLHFVEEEQVLE
ncbi:MAG: saccharopine dehydrogenase [Cytophagales bacterium CG18_big_fil_WC_8_21_14_2_50_42_9]|nr:MAG: saccharopine dehydrogenase [Cytophagales bacterium CG18_big_fil_WC_8_21_14_2_50_42_9]